MQQLSPNDAVFLALETKDLPAHIGGLAFLEPTEETPDGGAAAFYEQFVEAVRDRIGACERFSWRLQEVPFGLDRPYWVKQRKFDPADHIRRVGVPSPAGSHEVAELAGMLFERPMDRTRPLWDMTLLEGLPGGRVAMLWRVHHCLMDGASGANLTEQLFDIAPGDWKKSRPVNSHVVDRAKAGRPMSAIAMAERAVRNATTELPARQGRILEKFVRSAVTARRDSKASGSSDEAAAQSNEESVLAPRVPFNGRVRNQRRISWSSVSLDEVKRIKNEAGVTVNDVVLAITSGAVRNYLAEHDALPKESLIASVPSSTRKDDDKTLGNQVKDLSIPWATDIEHPLERLSKIHQSASRVKASAQGDSAVSMMDVMTQALLPGAVNLLMQGAAAASPQMPLPANAVVSNVPMTPFPLYCAGARIVQMVPFSLLAPTQGLNITVLSYCGELHFGIAHDPELVPDAWSLAEGIPKSFVELQHAMNLDMDLDGNQFDLPGLDR